METYSVRNLNFWYPKQQNKAINNLSLDIHQGEFLTVCGPSGCGKSTLLRQLKTVLAPHGFRQGEILFEGRELKDIDFAVQSARIGFVQQSPENQIVTDKVWHEMAFGLESLGYETEVIRSRVAEMASFFGIQNWFYKNVTELSGGQKQLLNLASIMAMQPSVLILDEPTSQLDPIAASDFLATIGKINRELGTTVIISEHRLEEVFPMTDRVVVMDRGSLIALGDTKAVGKSLKERGHSMFLAMPAAMQIWAAVDNRLECPVTVRDGRDWLEDYSKDNELISLKKRKIQLSKEDAISTDKVWFKYEKDGPDIIKGLSLTLRKGELLALLGGNGTGKTTTLSIISGLNKPYRGDISVNGSLAQLPQNPQSLFVRKTVREDLFEVFKGGKMPADIQEERVARVVSLCRLEELLDRHPYDLSGGEQQRAALAKVLLLDPNILLLDEPTKGLDAEFKQVFALILKTLLKKGVSILMVSHDIEFCAEYADECALFFDGNVVTKANPLSFFCGNSFYTTSANRIARGIADDVVTARDLISVCGGVLPKEPDIPSVAPLPVPDENNEDVSKVRLPKWRVIAASLFFCSILFGFIRTVTVNDLSALITSDGLRTDNIDFLSFWTVMIGLLGFSLCVSKKSKEPVYPVQLEKEKRQLSKRTVLASGIILLMIPVTLFVGIFYLNNKSYYLISLLILAETMAPFFMIFEGRKPKARELVVIAVLCAIGVAGRAAFFMLPNFKPVLAIVIIAGVGLGAETGFLVGAMTMLVSNMMFGQGPWTPYQMFSMGIIGFLAGILFRKGVLRRTRASLCIFGALSAIIIYGGLMNPASALIWARTLTKDLLLTYYVTGLPVDLVHAFGTALFLWFGAEPMLEKLERIKIKYGILC